LPGNILESNKTILVFHKSVAFEFFMVMMEALVGL